MFVLCSYKSSNFRFQQELIHPKNGEISLSFLVFRFLLNVTLKHSKSGRSKSLLLVSLQNILLFSFLTKTGKKDSLAFFKNQTIKSPSIKGPVLISCHHLHMKRVILLKLWDFVPCVWVLAAVTLRQRYPSIINIMEPPGDIWAGPPPIAAN